MKYKVLNKKFLAVISIAIFTFAIYAKFTDGEDKFVQAKDFPKGALLYVQVKDLPKLFELWNESKIKSDYLQSINYKEFKNRHLALKLAERWAEFNSAFSVPFGANTFGNLSENKASLAIYDIGKLDLVFIAPMSNEKILASYFFQNQSGFEENELEDGNVFFNKEIEVDRGRQKQNLLFMKYKGRLIFATNKALFFRTLANLDKNTKNESLAEEFEFKSLAEKSETNLLTVWINQTKLNNDWYFKHYWLMNNFEDLKKIRAGMFDFKLKESELIEHRSFLKSDKDNNKTSNLSKEKIASLLALIPGKVPYHKITSLEEENSIRKLFRKTLLDNYSVPTVSKPRSNDYFMPEYFEDENTDYSYLSRDFEKEIDDKDDAEVSFEKEQTSLRTETENKLLNELQNVLDQAKPEASVYLLNPKKLANPLFMKTEKALIFSVANRNGFSKKRLENSILDLLQNRLAVANSKAKFEWIDKGSDVINWRAVKTPFLDWEFYYALKDSEVIFSNDEDFLLKILQNETDTTITSEIKDELGEFEMIDFSERQKNFDDVMKRILHRQTSDEKMSDFFVDNVGSLLDVLSEVESVEIKRYSSKKFVNEEIIYYLRDAE